MSFDFSDLVVADDNDENDNYDYTQFLAEPIYDWLNFPDAVLQTCDDLEEEKAKNRKVTIIQQAQPQNTVSWKKVSYRRGPYRKRNRNNSSS